ncbi:hypothetical protein BC629DRAFT_349154 [Irpex lacteus]|nr:hypothetical protein BC629DRAFT_349154 [Irpex lacteus]
MTGANALITSSNGIRPSSCVILRLFGPRPILHSTAIPFKLAERLAAGIKDDGQCYSNSNWDVTSAKPSTTSSIRARQGISNSTTKNLPDLRGPPFRTKSVICLIAWRVFFIFAARSFLTYRRVSPSNAFYILASDERFKHQGLVYTTIASTTCGRRPTHYTRLYPLRDIVFQMNHLRCLLHTSPGSVSSESGSEVYLCLLQEVLVELCRSVAALEADIKMYIVVLGMTWAYANLDCKAAIQQGQIRRMAVAAGSR